MERPRFSENPAFVESERLIRQLHELNAQGKGESDEAVAIQEADEGPWYALNPEERTRIHGLSADLYMLTGEEIHEPTDLTQDQLRTALQDAWRRNDALQMLSLLRKGPTCLKDHQIAYFRWKYYRALGQNETAFLFIEYAAKLAPAVYYYRIAWLETMIELGRRNEAHQAARVLVSDQNAHPYLHIHAAALLMPNTAQQDVVQWQQLLAVLKRALEKESSLPTSQRHAKGQLLGFIVLSFCYRQTGHTFMAKQTYAKAFALDPTVPTDLADALSRSREAEAELSTEACEQAEASAMVAA